MKSLLLAINFACILFAHSCSNNSRNEQKESSSPSDYSKSETLAPTDTIKSAKSAEQHSSANQPDYKSNSHSDTTKHIYFHGSPNQQQVDSIKNAKTLKKK